MLSCDSSWAPIVISLRCRLPVCVRSVAVGTCSASGVTASQTTAVTQMEGCLTSPAKVWVGASRDAAEQLSARVGWAAPQTKALVQRGKAVRATGAKPAE